MSRKIRTNNKRKRLLSYDDSAKCIESMNKRFINEGTFALEKSIEKLDSIISNSDEGLKLSYQIIKDEMKVSSVYCPDKITDIIQLEVLTTPDYTRKGELNTEKKPELVMTFPYDADGNFNIGIYNLDTLTISITPYLWLIEGDDKSNQLFHQELTKRVNLLNKNNKARYDNGINDNMESKVDRLVSTYHVPERNNIPKNPLKMTDEQFGITIGKFIVQEYETGDYIYQYAFYVYYTELYRVVYDYCKKNRFDKDAVLKKFVDKNTGHNYLRRSVSASIEKIIRPKIEDNEWRYKVYCNYYKVICSYTFEKAVFSDNNILCFSECDFSSNTYEQIRKIPVHCVNLQSYIYEPVITISDVLNFSSDDLLDNERERLIKSSKQDFENTFRVYGIKGL